MARKGEITKKKKAKGIKQKQKQQISIVINSNNRSKRTTAPKQAPNPESKGDGRPAYRNNPPIIMMGDTRPQVSASGNYSGLGQQNRIFSTDSALEQRLARLLKFENDQSANPAPALSNAKVLPPRQYTSPVPTRRKSALQAPPQSRPVMDLDYFNTRRKEYEANQASSPLPDDDEETTPSVMDRMKETFSNVKSSVKNIFKPKPATPFMPAVGQTLTPIQPYLDDVSVDDEEKEPELEPSRAVAVAKDAGRKIDENNLGNLVVPWKKMSRTEKREWATANIGEGDEDVRYDALVVGRMFKDELDELYASVILARRRRLANPY